MLRPQAKSILTNKPKNQRVILREQTSKKKKFAMDSDWSVSEALDSIPEITEERYEEEKQST